MLALILNAQQYNYPNPGTGSWIVPDGVNMITVYCWGAGGAGGNAKNLGVPPIFNGSGGSGGSGGFNKAVNYSVVPGQIINFTVGAGGQYDPNYQSTNPGGGVGGGTSVSTNSINIVSATGGAGGGKVNTNNLPAINGTAGSPSGNNGSNTAGGSSTYTSTAPYLLGMAPQWGGGSIASGAGGNNGTVATTTGASNGANGNNRGGGGGGGSVKENNIIPSLQAHGGNGGNGAVVICARKLALNETNLNWNCIDVNGFCPVKYIQLAGNYLLSSIIVTPPAGYIVSNTASFTTFGTSTSPLSISVSGGLQYDIGTTLYVKLQSTATPGQFNGNLTVACSGTPGVTTKSVALNAVVSQIPNASLTLSGNNSFCQGDSVIITSANNSGYTYQWSNTGNIVVGSTNTFTAYSSGNYSVIISDNLGCSVTSSTITVIEMPLPIATITSDNELTYCVGQQIQNILSVNSAANYLWNTGDTIQSIVATSPGVFSVNIFDANGCQNTDSIQITVNPLPNVNAGNDQTICQGETLSLAGNGATTYSWNNGITNNVAFSPTQSNDYIVIGTDIDGCQDSDTVIVTVNSNSSSQLTETAVSSYILNGQTYTQSGTYTQVIPNAAGCDSTITLNLTINSSGLDELINDAILIFPNPANNQINIEYDGQIQKLEIVDFKGAKVYSSTENKKVYALPTNIETGYYMLVMSTDEGAFRKELMIQR
jgi:hypothetical protein